MKVVKTIDIAEARQTRSTEHMRRLSATLIIRDAETERELPWALVTKPRPPERAVRALITEIFLQLHK